MGKGVGWRGREVGEAPYLLAREAASQRGSGEGAAHLSIDLGPVPHVLVLELFHHAERRLDGPRHGLLSEAPAERSLCHHRDPADVGGQGLDPEEALELAQHGALVGLQRRVDDLLLGAWPVICAR